MYDTLWNILVSLEMKIVIEQKISPTVDDLATDVDEFYRLLKEEMVADLRYFNSLEKEVEYLQSQLELQQIKFSNEIDRLSMKYFYANHMNDILSFYTTFDEYSDMSFQGKVTIKRVYYVEGINHILFSVGQFCDADLEVAFRKSSCHIHDLKGNDILAGSRGTDLYPITL
ncbi:hypothetical protein Tco_0117328 [Tanacetum coccineum]